MEQNKGCYTFNFCGCCNGTKSEDGKYDERTPVGTVISYMGTKAPKNYVICDGSVYNIADYPALSNQIQEEFGLVDYFGGDGLETFAVPDLRNEFLRGYHGKSDKLLSGEIGKSQHATKHVGLTVHPLTVHQRALQVGGLLEEHGVVSNADTIEYSNNFANYITDGTGIHTNTNIVESYTSHPNNVAVLYCIKYD